MSLLTSDPVSAASTTATAAVVVWTEADLVAEGRRVVDAEARALASVSARLDHRFAQAVHAIAACDGRVVTAAVGKSGCVARKLASTLSSLGTPACFIHPTEGVHGDLGMLRTGDLIIAISHSGNSEELVSFLAAARLRTHAPVIALGGSTQGRVAAVATIVLDTGVTEEACALGLAPTASSTAALALGDALAVAVSRMKGFHAQEFATLHPGGALGDRLRTPVEQIMRRDCPRVAGERRLRDTIEAMGLLGVVIVDDPESGRIGIITDGDLRRAAHAADDGLDRLARDVMSTPPRSVPLGTLGFEALLEMERERVTSLLVLDRAGQPAGMLHIHDILRFGLGITREPSKARAQGPGKRRRRTT